MYWCFSLVCLHSRAAGEFFFQSVCVYVCVFVFVCVCACVCVCVCVCVSYRSKGVRDNSRRFTHVSKNKITTAAVGPFIS